MVVKAGRCGESAVWRRRLAEPFPGLSGHTTTQPSSIEEEGYCAGLANVPYRCHIRSVRP
jgi:hypothetical protein